MEAPHGRGRGARSTCSEADRRLVAYQSEGCRFALSGGVGAIDRPGSGRNNAQPMTSRALATLSVSVCALMVMLGATAAYLLLVRTSSWDQVHRGYYETEANSSEPEVRWARGPHSEIEIDDDGTRPLELNVSLVAPHTAPEHGLSVLISVDELPVARVETTNEPQVVRIVVPERVTQSPVKLQFDTGTSVEVTPVECQQLPRVAATPPLGTQSRRTLGSDHLTEIRLGRSDQDSSPCPTPPRSHAQTPAASRHMHRLPQWLGAGSSNRRRGRRRCRST